MGFYAAAGSSADGAYLRLDSAPAGGIRAATKMKPAECAFLTKWIEDELAG